ncbi:glycoside hydrolase family 3 protein [Amphibacillus xylanus]|uniref:Putative hydrolase n=1 Tax=Amphibacillus xylanus (strain ATCC 51415 / DSM 6626 / JCM 7361 / LMG 17667 / NBRC 15112 / Ep01) TaxID=698758 RepID=K0J0L8_AMPXN|nr:glycoside hydrolase family 3 protein [Amphibacillus xylanus]BAM48420.1 putative hydrolase [Amphibacillus xylanus NBRC 15112]
MNVASITRIIFIAVVIISALILTVAFIRGRKKRKIGGVINRKQKWGTALLSLLLIIVVVANGAIYELNNIINQYFSTVVVNEATVTEAADASRDLTQKIVGEGIVLLENKEGILPLDGSSKINVFGMSSIRPIYGGIGSGAGDESANVTLQQGLEQAGFTVNDELTMFYEDRAPAESSTNIFALQGGNYDIFEPSANEYSESIINNAKEFSDVALVMFSRSGGEGGDLPMDMSSYEGGDADKHYLELQKVESDMLELVKSNFDKVIVVINSSNAMELGFLEEEGIDAALWIGGPGSTGFTAVGQVLSGEVNPSGRLVDTYAYDLTTAPAYYNAGNFDYVKNGKTTGEHYLEYAEGIYVGYRYYETRYVDNETGEVDQEVYDDVVQYPFGYGKSFTEFTQELVSHDEKNGKISVEVRVTNTGDVPGKEVVQVYYTPPYIIGGIEKSHVVLADFGKTKILEPNESETVTLEFNVEDMASYDYKDNGCYVLDSGNYQIKVMSDAHNVIDSFDYSVEKTVVFNEDNPRSGDLTAAVNRFDDALGDVTYVSRADWEGTLPKERVETKEASDELLYTLNANNAVAIYAQDDDTGIADITTGANNGLVLEDMVGIDYEDEKWDKLLDQLSVSDMSNLIGYGGFGTIEVESIKKDRTINIDGPAGLNSLTNSDLKGVQFQSQVVLASTFNKELANEMGIVFGDEAVSRGVAGLYAPGVNLHRTPFSGRNFEYYSEDPILTAKIGSEFVQGLKSRGVFATVKHFALNDQEINRSGVAVWSNEQAIRELYLKAFEDIVKSGQTTAIMSSYNRIGTVWAGGNKALLTDVLRNEWGFVGMVISDYANGDYMNVDQSIRAGGDIMLSTLGDTPTEASTSTHTGKQAMRRATKNILYTVVNSHAVTEPVTYGFPYWLLLLGTINFVLLGISLTGFIKLTSTKESLEKSK